MKKKTTKRPAKKTTKVECKNVLCRPATWIFSACILAFMLVTATLLYGVVIKNSNNYTAIENGKLATWSGIAKGFLADQQINTNYSTLNVMTGYGVSDEDNTFYITFNYYIIGADGQPNMNTPHAAIMYVYSPEQTGHGSNGYAFGYYDDDPTYHPSGVYQAVTSEQ